jgi:hypothetical protein
MKGISAEEKEAAEYLENHMDDSWDETDLRKFTNSDSVRPKITILQTVIQQKMEQFTKEKSKFYLAEILGTSQGIVFDLMSAQIFSRKLEEFVPMTADQLKEVK